MIWHLKPSIKINKNLLEVLRNRKISNVTVLQNDISNLDYISKEIDNLLWGHASLSRKTLENLTLFEKNIRDRGIYDFRAGRKILSKLKNLGMEILLSEKIGSIDYHSITFFKTKRLNR